MKPGAVIGVVTTSYPRFAGDAAGSFVAAHVAELRRDPATADATVEIVAAGEPRAATAENTEHITRVGAGAGLFYAGGAPDALEAGTSKLAALRFSVALAATVARRAPRWDAVVAHWWSPSAIAALSTRGPLLAIAHGGDVHLLARLGLLTPTVAALAARRARPVFVSEALAARTTAAVPGPLARWLERHACVQPMGIDLQRFAQLARTRPRADGASRPTIAVLARLVPIKGVDVLLDALGRVATPVDVVIAGDGPARAALEQRARALVGSAHTITFVGALAADARDHLLARATAVVVPSRALANGRTEGTPMVALEALATGVPVIAAETGGLAQLPAPVATFPPGDSAALAERLVEVLAAPPSAAHCQAAAAGFAWAQVAPRLREHWFGL